MAVYSGFSTVSSLSQKKFVLVDNDLIKQDLLNAFQTRRGSRLMQPNFGCVAWEKIFETISPTDVEDITNNIQSIVNADPRVTMVSLDVTPSAYNIVATLVLRYTATNQIEQMVISFNSEIGANGGF